MKPRASTRRLAAALPWLCAAWVLLSCAPALAHATLVRSEPAEGAELAESPQRVELLFNEPVDAEFSPLEVRDSSGERVDEGDARVDPRDARVVLVGLEELPEGTYEVRWRVTSVDGHVVEGRYEFSVEAERTSSPGDTRQERTAEEHAGHTEHPATRNTAQGRDESPILAYSAMSLGAVGAVAVAGYLLSRLARRRSG